MELDSLSQQEFWKVSELFVFCIVHICYHSSLESTFDGISSFTKGVLSSSVLVGAFIGFYFYSCICCHFRSSSGAFFLVYSQINLDQNVS